MDAADMYMRRLKAASQDGDGICPRCHHGLPTYCYSCTEKLATKLASAQEENRQIRARLANAEDGLRLYRKLHNAPFSDPTEWLRADAELVEWEAKQEKKP